MTARPRFEILTLAAGDVPQLEDLLDVFGSAFGEPDTYGSARPDQAYLESLLASEHFIAVVALADAEVIGGLAAYVLPKFEQARCEIFVYDLAVAEAHRRRGVATALLRRVQRIASERGAWTVFIQAERDDAPAVSLYSKLGTREEALHFELPVPPPGERDGEA